MVQMVDKKACGFKKSAQYVESSKMNRLVEDNCQVAKNKNSMKQ